MNEPRQRVRGRSLTMKTDSIPERHEGRTRLSVGSGLKIRNLVPVGLLLGIGGLLWASSESSGMAPPGSGPTSVQSAASILGASAESAVAPQDFLSRIDRSRLLLDLSVLAHDSMEGRRTGTPGAERARRYLLGAFSEVGLASLSGTHSQIFTFSAGGGESVGTNILGVVRGRAYPDRYLVVTAHYDHLGIRGGQIYNGADDNASGTAALLALGRYFSANPTRHSLLFVAFDAEEVGLRGADAFVSAPIVPLSSIVMNVNLDMVSRSDKGELYAVGTHHYPSLRPLVEETARRSQVTLLTGHDTPGLPPGDDWTFASDHGPFHRERVPFIYFGVEDHADYHTPSDTFEAITPEFYLGAVETILDFILLADAAGESILRLPR